MSTNPSNASGTSGASGSTQPQGSNPSSADKSRAYDQPPGQVNLDAPGSDRFTSDEEFHQTGPAASVPPVSKRADEPSPKPK